MRINTLLIHHGIKGLLGTNDKPKYDERAPDSHDSDSICQLLATADSEERLLVEFYIGSGFREQEVMYATWGDVDWKGKVITVRSKPDLGFRPKDHEERSVPVPDSLIDALALRKRHHGSPLIFPGPNGKPDGHTLRILKRLAFRAGLNCGECVGKSITTKTGKVKGGSPVPTTQIATNGRSINFAGPSQPCTRRRA